jgi:hypothetical protein
MKNLFLTLFVSPLFLIIIEYLQYFNKFSYKPAVDNNTNRLLESENNSSLLLEFNSIAYCVRQRLVKLIRLNNNSNYNND